ncbi:MAG TPA: hypothetical protein VF135_07360 [Terriglobales bacterium]
MNEIPAPNIFERTNNQIATANGLISTTNQTNDQRKLNELG